MEWETRPGDNWEISPPEDLGDCAILVMEPGRMAAEWIRGPESLRSVAGLEHLAGTKLYIERRVLIVEGELRCPICQSLAAKRGLEMRGMPILIVECMNCEQFLWLEND